MDDDEVGLEPLDKAFALSARVGCGGARGDNGSGNKDRSSGSEKLAEVGSHGSSAGAARDLDALAGLLSECSRVRGAVLTVALGLEG